MFVDIFWPKTNIYFVYAEDKTFSSFPSPSPSTKQLWGFVAFAIFIQHHWDNSTYRIHTTEKVVLEMSRV